MGKCGAVRDAQAEEQRKSGCKLWEFHSVSVNAHTGEPVAVCVCMCEYSHTCEPMGICVCICECSHTHEPIDVCMCMYECSHT